MKCNMVMVKRETLILGLKVEVNIINFHNLYIKSIDSEKIIIIVKPVKGMRLSLTPCILKFINSFILYILVLWLKSRKIIF